MSSFEKIPERVKRAKRKSDTEALSIMGRAGGRASAEKKKEERRLQEIDKEYSSEKKWAVDHTRAKEANEDTVPIDDSPMGMQYLSPDARRELEDEEA